MQRRSRSCAELRAEVNRAEVKDVLAALRRVAPELENRSLRRGALQTLVKSGVSEDTLLLFSGHFLVADGKYSDGKYSEGKYSEGNYSGI